MITRLKFFFLFFFLHLSFISFAQTTSTSRADTVKEFQIIRGPSMRSIHVDSVTTLQTIAGGAVVKQGTTVFNADSIAINPATHIVEGFGNVHINQADSVQTYAQYLKYIGTEKMAYLKKDVRLTDKKGTVYTQDLDYNLETGIGNYHNGGKVINGKTTITSTNGTYYADTKDVYFRNNVELTEPKNHIITDSLLYNMQMQTSNFVGNTHIKNKEVDIYTTQGTYDYNTGNALFTTRTSVKDSSGRVYIANNMALDNKTGNAQLEGNAVVKDSVNGFIVFGNQIFLNKKNNSFLATRKPVLIIKQKSDSIYVAADTIFSGYTNVIKNEDRFLKKDSVIHIDSLQNLNADSVTTDSLKGNFPKKYSDSVGAISSINDSLNKQQPLIQKPKNDSFNILLNRANAVTHNVLQDKTPGDSLKPVMPVDSLKKSRTELMREKILRMKEDTLPDSAKNILPDSIAAKSDTVIVPALQKNTIGLKEKLQKDTTGQQDSVRYFLAFHHVRIFSDSLQSICDSLFFSAKDSIFRLYYDPVIWGGHSQITGDTIFLYTKNKKADRLYAFEKSMIINKTTQGFFNQIAGKTTNGYFVNGAINYMRVKGSQAESVYYAQDADSAYLGMNRASGDVIDLYFKNDDLIKVLFVNDIKGKFYPMRQIPADDKYLKNFIWLEDKRPKNKLELFE